MSGRYGVVLVVVGLLAAPVAAHEDGGPVDEIRVTSRPVLTATAPFPIGAEEFELRPLESGGQLLETVPGVLTAQHTGGGKAEQYFLRGFDADHGTDISVSFDGVPINLRGHAHGQGYLDLHFVPIDAIERLEVAKGPYSVRAGDFATAASIDYVTFHEVDRSSLSFEGGSWNTWRVAGVGSPELPFFGNSTGERNGLVAFEAYHTDGPLRDDEDLWRFSGLVRGDLDLSEDLRLSGHLLAYFGDWNASGLVPERQVESGALSRWGSLDSSEGGDSSRLQGKLQIEWEATDHARLVLSGYAVRYSLDLFSNFTYALGDPARGDGIVQRDDRFYAGGHLAYEHVFDLGFPGTVRGGLDWRWDDSRVRLGTQTLRSETGTLGDDDVRELSLAPYLELTTRPLPWIRVEGGLRYERFDFDVKSRIGGGDGEGDDAVWLPKANVVLSPFSSDGPLPSTTPELHDLELFLNSGIGFHSNDPRSGVGDERILSRAKGAEIGIRTRVGGRADLAATVFWLSLEDELVFVGDAGTTDSSGPSRRLGVEIATRIDVTDWLTFRGDVAYTSARNAGGPIVQAPRFVGKASLVVERGGFRAELGARSLGERYATEASRSIRLSDYTVLDLGLRYRAGDWEVGLSVENLMDRDWRSSEFLYPSCAPLEVGTSLACPTSGGGPGIEDRHFTPGNRRNLLVWIRFVF